MYAYNLELYEEEMEGEFELAFEIVKFSKSYHPFCNVSKSAVYMSNVLLIF